MENTLSILVYSISFLTLCVVVKLHFQRKQKLPPGPKPWPIIGNILALTNKPHHALSALSSIHGPLMTLHLGKVRTVIISSSEVAKDAFTNHDLTLSSRQAPNATLALNHRHRSMVWLPVSHQWRNLRKLSAIQLFTTKRLDASESLRRTKVFELLEHVAECCRSGQPVDIGKAAFTTSLNLLSNTFFSTDLAGYGTTSSGEFRDVVWGMMECLGKPNLADFFPLLAYFDPSGIRRDTSGYFGKLFELFDGMIERRNKSDGNHDDVLETLLGISREEDSGLTTEDIKHMLLDLIGAGTDTTSSTIEWAMTELLRYPSKLEKAQSELNRFLLTKSEAVIQESDIEKLHYLRAIVKETLRLHPPAPLLVPHKARDDVELQGYFIPKNTQVLVNVWAIGRDPTTWKNPEEFMPERFLERVDVDVKGRDFELIPFGVGRRICPRLPLAYRMVHVMLGGLLHGFDWKLPNGMRVEEIDMDDRFGLTLQKAKPLLALPLTKGIWMTGLVLPYKRLSLCLHSLLLKVFDSVGICHLSMFTCSDLLL